MKPKQTPPKAVYDRASIFSTFQNHSNAYSAILLLCWVFFLYWRVFAAPFVYDDLSTIQTNSTITTFHSALSYFRTAVPFGADFLGPGGSYYRPLTWLSFALDRALWGLWAPGYHLTNLLLHWMNGWLGYLLLRRVSVPVPAALGTCLIWLALPVNSEVVSWASARSHLMAFLFVLLALLSACGYVQTRRAAALVCYFCCALLGLLCHELAVLLLPFTAIVITPLKGWLSRAFIPLFSAAALADAIYGVVRRSAGGTSPATLRSLWPVGFSFFKYVGWLVMPIRMSIERSTDTPPAGFSIAAGAALLFLIALLAGAVLLRNKAPEILGGIAWTFAALLPVSGLIFLYQGIAERYDYMASCGLVFAAVSVPAHIRDRRAKTVIVCCLIAWMFASTARLYARLGDWTEEAKLYLSSLEATPRSWILLLNLGNAYLQRGDLPAAIRTYQQSLEVKPDATKAVINLGAALEMQGNLTSAEEQFRRAIALDPKRADAYADLATVLYQEGRIHESAALFRKAIELNPRDATSYFNLGILYAHAGLPEIAKEMYGRALAINPGYADAKRALGQLRENGK